MITVSLQSNIEEVSKSFNELHREHIPLAVAKALTFTAERVRAAEISEMQRVFDRPTPFTLKSLFLSAATPRRLEAHVWFKWPSHGKRHYLLPQIEGGKRERKVFEQYLLRAGVMRGGWFTVPGSGAKLDKYGNWSRGQLIQVLSALKALPETGYLANRSAASLKRRKRKLPEFFVGRPGGGRLPLGVWQRIGNRVLPILIIVSKNPQYQRRFDFYGVARKVVAREFDILLNRELQRIRTAAAMPIAA